MRVTIVLAAAALFAPVTAHAQETGGERRFTRHVMDVNRNDKIVYVPLGWHFPGPRPAAQQYAVSAASWYVQPLGASGVRPDRTADGGEYVLEQFAPIESRANQPVRLRVVVTRRPGPAPGDAPPQISVIHTDSQLSVQAFPEVTMVPGGVRYTFEVESPSFGFAPRRVSGVASGPRYEIRFLPREGVRVPSHIAKAPTFGGMDIQSRMAQAPPRVNTTERVAGRRQEFRNRERDRK